MKPGVGAALLGVVLVAGVGTACSATTGQTCDSACHSAGSSPPVSSDSFGDPIISDAQGRAVRVGESAADAFGSLGGKAVSGQNGSQAVPPLSYDYPVRGTGNPNDVTDTGTIYWQICVQDGVVVSKQRAVMDRLPAMC